MPITTRKFNRRIRMSRLARQLRMDTCTLCFMKPRRVIPMHLGTDMSSTLRFMDSRRVVPMYLVRIRPMAAVHFLDTRRVLPMYLM